MMQEKVNNDDDFKRIYIKYSRLVMDTAYSVLNEKELAEDAFQLAFVSIAKNLDHIIDNIGNEKEKAEKYIKMKARNAAIDIYRKYRKIRQNEIPIVNEEESDEDDYTENSRKYKKLSDVLFEEKMFNILDKKHLNKSLKKLDKDSSQYIREFFYEDLTARQIAERHDISLAAAWKRIYRSLDRLKTIFFEKEGKI